MSYEYQIQMKDTGNKSLFELLAEQLVSSDTINFRVCDNIISIRDSSISNTWDYDIRFYKKGNDLSVALVGWSLSLYLFIKSVLGKYNIEIMDDDEGLTITLEQMFKIN